MAMYFMNGKTFINTFMNENPETILKAQYVIVSSTIRKNGKYKDQVMQASSELFPRANMITDFDDYKHNQNFIEEYKDILDENKPLLCTLIRYSILEDATVIFLCGKREHKRYAFFNILQEYIEDEFGFHIYDYKKYKEGKEKAYNFSKSLVIERCNKVLKHAKKEAMERKLSTERGRQTLSKKDLKKELKKRGLYVPDMSKDEMLDTLNTFL